MQNRPHIPTYIKNAQFCDHFVFKYITYKPVKGVDWVLSTVKVICYISTRTEIRVLQYYGECTNKPFMAVVWMHKTRNRGIERPNRYF